VRKLVLVNQTANYLFADILAAFVRRCPGREIEAWYGSFTDDVSRVPATVRLRRGPAYDRSSGVRRLVSWLRFHWWVRGLLTKEDPLGTHFFFVSNPPLFVFLPGLERLRYDCLLYDLYPHVLDGAGRRWATGLVTRAWARRNARVFPHAGRIYTISEGMRRAVCGSLPSGTHDRVTVVPLWADRSGADRPSPRDLRTEWGLTGKKVLLYAGNLGLTHPVEPLLDLATRLRGHDEWRLLIVGSGPRRRALEQRARGMENVLLKDPVPGSDLPNVLALATWGCVVLDARAGAASVPSKAYNLLAAGIPLLAMVPPGSEIAALVKTERLGLCFTADGIEAAVAGITSVGPHDHAALSANARRCARRFTPELAEAFTDVCHEWERDSEAGLRR
jgi:colanic acid biosynthesis glycosyl transferase WcaI